MGKVTVVGGKVGMTEPVIPITTIPASSIAVGSTVYLMENGSPVEYLVVNQGKPSNSSLYGSSCKGMWLLRKDVYAKKQWDDNINRRYHESTIHSYLNSDFFNLFDTNTQSTIKQVKIPYVNNSNVVASGADGISAKVFLLSGYELGWTTSNSSGFPVEGACLSYFKGLNVSDSKRIAYLNNTKIEWWTRSLDISNSAYRWYVDKTGDFFEDQGNFVCGVRPALVIPSTSLFDEKTLVLMGV